MNNKKLFEFQSHFKKIDFLDTSNMKAKYPNWKLSSMNQESSSKSLLDIILNKIPQKPCLENLYYLKLFLSQNNLSHLYRKILTQVVKEYMLFHFDIQQTIRHIYYQNSFQGHVDIIIPYDIIHFSTEYVTKQYRDCGGEQSQICLNVIKYGWRYVFRLIVTKHLLLYPY